MILTECNYHIYNKKLLTIIYCFEHWQLKLKHTDLLIQIFTDYQTLKIFMKNKELIHHQIRYLNVLSEFNFQVIFWTGKINSKVNAFTQMLNDFNKNLIFQTILTSDCVKIWVREVKESFFKCVYAVNKINNLCSKYHSVIIKDDVKLHDTYLYKYWIVNEALFKNNLLWVLKSLYTELLQKVHN